MATRRQLQRPMNKSRSNVSTLTVVSNGVRKARSIKKFQDAYYVGLAYVGLMQLDKKVTDRGANCWKGSMDVENPISLIRVYVTITQKFEEYSSNYTRENYFDTREGYYRSENWHDTTHYSPEDIEVWQNNMEGISKSSFKFEMDYYAENLSGSSTLKRIFEFESEYSYPSIEDTLDAIERESEEAWGQVTIYLNDNAQTYQNIRDSEALYPSTVSITLPTGEPLVLNMNDYGSTRMGNWYGSKSFTQENILMEVKARIRAVTSDENGGFSDEGRDFTNYRDSYSVDRNNALEYYAVDVFGTIADGNTQMNADRGGYEKSDSWARSFTGQGSQTLEGAVAIAESNIAEVYQEWQDFINSTRNYEKVGHGQGYRRTIENTEPWNYNYGDSSDDRNYEEWQGYDEYNPDSPISVSGMEWDADSYWKDADASVFLTEYLGTDLAGAIDIDTNYNDKSTLYFSESNWRVNSDLRAKIKQEKTRDDVERVANFMGLKLVDYTDPLNFVLSKSMKKRVRKSKPAHIYYDVEMRRMKSMRKSRQAQPKSFNSMVKSIRAKNNKRKVL